MMPPACSGGRRLPPAAAAAGQPRLRAPWALPSRACWLSTGMGEALGGRGGGPCAWAASSPRPHPAHAPPAPHPRTRPRRIGTEHEKLGYTVGDTRRLTYEQIAALLTRIQDRFGWAPIIEEGAIIGLLQDGQSVTLEPGGQFELSGAVVDTLHKTCAEVNSHLYQVCVGVGWVGGGGGR